MTEYSHSPVLSGRLGREKVTLTPTVVSTMSQLCNWKKVEFRGLQTLDYKSDNAFQSVFSVLLNITSGREHTNQREPQIILDGNWGSENDLSNVAH
jgi:hypothetical protein